MECKCIIFTSHPCVSYLDRLQALKGMGGGRGRGAGPGGMPSPAQIQAMRVSTDVCFDIDAHQIK